VSEVEHPIAEPEPTQAGQQRWLLGAVVAALLGLLLYLAIQYTGPSTVSDERLEADAIEAVEQGRALEAAEHYGELASRSLDDRERAGWMLEQAGALVQAERSAEASAVLESAATLDLSDEDLHHRILVRLAGIRSALGQHDDAREVFLGIIGNESTSPEYLAIALVGQLDIATEAGNTDEGMALIHEHLGLHPDNPEISLALARRISELLMARDRAAEALVVLEMLPGDGWEAADHASWLILRASVLDQLQELDAALELYQRALQVVGTDGDQALLTRFEVAGLLTRRGDLQAARDHLLSLEAESEGSQLQCHVKLELAEVMNALGDRAAAEALYRGVIEGWPELDDAVATAREGLGNLLLADGGDGGIAAHLEALEAGGDRADAAKDVLLGYANGLLMRGDPEQALATFDAVRASASQGDHWAFAAEQGRANALIQLERFNDALEQLRALRAVGEAQQRLQVDAQIGELLLVTGQLDQAQIAFESLLEVSAEMGYGTSAAQLGLAGVAESQERYEQAAHLYQQVADARVSQDQQVSALQALASLYPQLGRDEEALVAFRQLESLLSPDSPALTTARMAVAEVYARSGDSERERRIWHEAVERSVGAPRAWALIRLVELDMAQAAELGDPAGIEAALDAMRALRGHPDMVQEHLPDVVFGELVCLMELGRYEQALLLLDEAASSGILGEQTDVFDTLRAQAEAGARGEPLDPDLADLPAPGQGPSDEEMAGLLERVALAGQARDQGRHEQALAAFTELQQQIDDRPTQASILREIASTHAAMGDLEAARESLRFCLSEYADLDEAVFLAGLAMADLDLRESDSLAALQRLDSLEAPDEGLALWRLELMARAQASAGDSDTALQTWRDAIELTEGDPSGSVVAWSGLGDLYVQIGESKKASDAYQRAAILAPDAESRASTRLRAAQVAIESARLLEAQDIIEEIQGEELQGELAVQVALTASALAQERGDWQASFDAVSGLETSKLGPDYHAMVVDARGQSLLALGRADAARSAYDQLQQRWPAHSEVDAVVSFGIADIEAAQGQLDAAAARYEAFVARSDDRFRQGQALLRMAQTYDTHGEGQLARAMFQRVQDDYADEPELAQTAKQALQ
jgi:tetratricopeptide (TPR) repeat protein